MALPSFHGVCTMVIVAALLVLGAPAIGTTSPDAARADLLFKEGLGLEQQRDYSAAIGKFTEALRLDPTFGFCYEHRAWLYVSTKREDLALADFKSFVVWSPSDSKAYNQLGEYYVYKRQWRNALEIFDYAMSHRVSNIETRWRRGELFLAIGRKREADEDFNWAQRYDSAFMNDLGKDIALARHAGQQATVSHRRQGDTIADAARAFGEERWRDTVDILDPIVSARPDNADARLLRAKALRELGESALASEDVDAALSLRPRSAEAYEVRAAINEDYDRHAQAIQDYDESIRLAPNIAITYVERAGVTRRYQPNMQGTALKYIETALTIEPHNPYAWYARANYAPVDLSHPGPNWEFEIANLDKALAYKTDFAHAYGERGVAEMGAYFDNHDNAYLERARRDLLKALELNPTDAATYDHDIAEMQLNMPAAVEYLKHNIEMMRAGMRANHTRRSAGGSTTAASQCGINGGEAASCKARDWMAYDRYRAGAATQDDKVHYGDY